MKCKYNVILAKPIGSYKTPTIRYVNTRISELLGDRP